MSKYVKIIFNIIIYYKQHWVMPDHQQKIYYTIYIPHTKIHSYTERHMS